MKPIFKSITLFFILLISVSLIAFTISCSSSKKASSSQSTTTPSSTTPSSTTPSTTDTTKSTAPQYFIDKYVHYWTNLKTISGFSNHRNAELMQVLVCFIHCQLNQNGYTTSCQQHISTTVYQKHLGACQCINKLMLLHTFFLPKP